ncbi:MAG: SAM-dependent methyltransferase [Streptosporangiaceae bacterium]|nr:SAM-dependent methyltransferase [Streptosporangiaceae bacterium]
MTEDPQVPAGVDTSVPTPARIYDYMLLGRSYFEADKGAAEQILTAAPEIRDAAFSNRGFHQRAATWIARQGIRQFVDIGSGLPTVGNTHEVVQQVIPSAHVVYVDNDPMVELHSRDLIDSGGTISVICGDLREPDSILDHPDLTKLIDFSQPVGLLMTGVMMFVSDTSDPWALVQRYVDLLAPGSYLSLSHLTDDYKPPLAAEGFRAVFDTATEHMYFRSKAKVARFFDGLELVPPYQGAQPEVTFTGIWGAEDKDLADSEGSRWLYCGVARKP